MSDFSEGGYISGDGGLPDWLVVQRGDNVISHEDMIRVGIMNLNWLANYAYRVDKDASLEDL